MRLADETPTEDATVPYPNSLLWLMALACLMALGVSTADAQSEKAVVREHLRGGGNGKSLAILIGVQNYTGLPPLQYCEADVQLLSDTLRNRCQFDQVIRLLESSDDAALRPTLGNISRVLRQWLRVANTQHYQRVLIYFSGHGFRGPKQRLYFAPPDCDREALELTALPQSTVKALLDGCTNVPVKLLVLDCCHAGEGRGDGVGTSGSQLASVFQDARGLLTLASCRDNEVSLEWPAKRHGLFTYWLCQGLQGAADRDNDGLVDSSELHKFVYNRVLRTAAEMQRTQTVVLRASDDWQGVAVLGRPGQSRPEQATSTDAVWLGVSVGRLDRPTARRHHLKPDAGVQVAAVYFDSPAERAGIQAGDVILRADGTPTRRPRHLANAMDNAAPGGKSVLQLVHDGQLRQLTVHWNSQPSPAMQANQVRARAKKGEAWAQQCLAVFYQDGFGVPTNLDEGIRWLRKAAEQDHAPAVYAMGCVYESGTHLSQDEAAALTWFRKAAQLGSPDAEARLGCYYLYGRGGLQKDEETAIDWLTPSAEAGVVLAQYHLGLLLLRRGELHEGDGWLRKAAVSYREEAESGNRDAQFQLAEMYYVGQGLAKDVTEAVHWYGLAARQNHVEAAFRLGNIHCDAAEYQEAFRWYRQAAEQGYPAAQTNLGVLYNEGYGVDQDLREAVKWFRRAAEAGHQIGQSNLGESYHAGMGVTRNQAEAVRWIRRSAEQRYAPAQAALGNYYHNGDGLPKNRRQAVHWYYKAGEQGHAGAQFMLGWLAANHPDGDHDFATAVRWFERSAEQGYVDAQYVLGRMYQSGNGVDVDLSKAAHWYRQAAENGDTRSADALRSLQAAANRR